LLISQHTCWRGRHLSFGGLRCLPLGQNREKFVDVLLESVLNGQSAVEDIYSEDHTDSLETGQHLEFLVRVANGPMKSRQLDAVATKWQGLS